MSSPDFSGRTAILGGTFNPVHTGHLRLALEAAEKLGLARVELTPCAVPPHKADKGLLPFPLREVFLRAAVESAVEARNPNEPELAVSTLEAELALPSYTANLLRAWTARHGETPLFMLGDEDFACLDTWRDGLTLPGLADFVVVPRSGAGPRLFSESLQRFWPGTPLQSLANAQDILYARPAVAGTARSCVFLPLPRLDISASQVRLLWNSTRSVRYLVPDAVLRLMHTHAAALRKAWTL